MLLVDDEPLNLRVLRDLLEDRYTVHEAADGAQALEIAGRAPLDVVIADQRMPRMTGVDMLTELRRRRPDVAGIVLTAYTDMAALESAINRAAVFRFLKKPWEPPEILGAIEQASAHVAQRRTIERLVSLLAARSEELRASLDRLERQQQMLLHLERLGTIGQLAAGVTHDLKNVMVGLRSAEWEMANTSVVSPSMREIITLGLSGVDNLLKTLQTLHDYARTGAMALQLGPVPPSVVVNDALAISRMDPLFKLREVESAVGADVPPLAADRQKLTQVVVNRVRHALQATQGGGAVRISAAARDGEVLLAVEDDGPGVSPDLKERIFEPFVSSKGQQGLGLGLYMSRLIVESHRGRIEVGDRPGGGARFSVIIPAAHAPTVATT